MDIFKDTKKCEKLHNKSHLDSMMIILLYFLYDVSFHLSVLFGDFVIRGISWKKHVKKGTIK